MNKAYSARELAALSIEERRDILAAAAEEAVAEYESNPELTIFTAAEWRFAKALKQMADAHGIESHASGYDDIGYECAVMKHYATTKEGRQDLCDCGLTAFRKIINEL